MSNINLPKRKFGFLLTLVFTGIFSQASLAQSGRDAGGSSGGGGVPPQPCATSFVRNNGNGSCEGTAQIRLYFTTPPVIAPVLQDIIYNEESLITNIYPITGNISDLATLGYISYCLPTSNIPPAIKLTLVLTYDGTGQAECILSGNN